MTPMNKVLNFVNSLQESDILTIFEGFLQAVNDADTYDTLVENMDISDDEMFRLRELVQNFMGE